MEKLGEIRDSGAADKAAIQRVRETEEQELKYTKSATIQFL